MELSSERFDAHSRLLIQALLSGFGVCGRAARLFRRLRNVEPPFSLDEFVRKLSQEEPAVHNQKLTIKPLVLLFPLAFRINLLSFLHLTHTLLSRPVLLHLLECVLRDGACDPWQTVLVTQLQRDVGCDVSLAPHYRQRLPQVCMHSSRYEATLGHAVGHSDWDPCPGKRKLEQEGPESDSKRMKVESAEEEDGDESEDEDGTPVSDLDSVLPPSLQVSFTRLKELLDPRTEWDQDASSVLSVFSECEPAHVALLCDALQLSELPEDILSKLCVPLVSLSPLSHSSASALLRSLFLSRMLSLSQPASRSLLTACVALSSRYPRPACCALIGPLLEAGHINGVQAELLCRLLKELEPQHKLLVFRQMLDVPWYEELLGLTHSLLDSQLEMTDDLLSLLCSQLCQHATHYSSSVSFARMLLTLLTKYQSQVNTQHKRSLSICLDSNQTFLKKSLVAALKRISP